MRITFCDFEPRLFLQFDLPARIDNRREIVGRSVQSGYQLADCFLFVLGSFALLDPAPQERGIEFETIELVLEVMNDLN